MEETLKVEVTVMDHHRHLLLTLYEPESRRQRVIGGNNNDSGDNDSGDNNSGDNNFGDVDPGDDKGDVDDDNVNLPLRKKTTWILKQATRLHPSAQHQHH